MKKEYNIIGLDCANCALTLEKYLQKVKNTVLKKWILHVCVQGPFFRQKCIKNISGIVQGKIRDRLPTKTDHIQCNARVPQGSTGISVPENAKNKTSTSHD